MDPRSLLRTAGPALLWVQAPCVLAAWAVGGTVAEGIVGLALAGGHGVAAWGLQRSAAWAPRATWGVAGALAVALAGATIGWMVAGTGVVRAAAMSGMTAIGLTVAWTRRPAHRWFVPARSTDVGWNLAKTVAQSVLFVGVFLGLGPWWVWQAEGWLGVPRVSMGTAGAWLLAAIVPLNLGQLGSALHLAVVGGGTPLPIDTARELVVRGAYAHVRNPIASLGIAQGLCLGVGLGSPGIVAYALAGGVVWHTFVRPIEEADLLERFGDAYARYREAVPLWWWRVRRWRPG